MGTIINIKNLILIVTAIFTLSACTKEGKLLLVASELVPVYRTLEDAMLPISENRRIAELQSQQQVEVVKCIDVKHYQVYEVRLSNETLGYINAGKYHLFRDGKHSHC